MNKLEQSDKEKALILMNNGASYQEVAEKTGVKVETLRLWKHRNLKGTAVPKSEAKPKAAAKVLRPSKPKAAINEPVGEPVKVAALQVSNNLMVQRNDDMEQSLTALQTEHETVRAQYAALQQAHDVLQQSENATGEAVASSNVPLVLAIGALHVSAVYGVGEILSSVFHTVVMGYLTAVVFVSSGLIMFLSKKLAVGVSWVVLVATFVLEAYCNYLTIYMKMEAVQLAAYQQYTNTGVLFFSIAVFVPLVTLAMEYLLFKQSDTE